MCYWCRHRAEVGSVVLRCTAFPAGIPEPILGFRLDHRRPVDGDGGVMFEADPALPKEQVEGILEVYSAKMPGGEWKR
jgi:hypothetical protein